MLVETRTVFGTRSIGVAGATCDVVASCRRMGPELFRTGVRSDADWRDGGVTSMSARLGGRLGLTGADRCTIGGGKGFAASARAANAPLVFGDAPAPASTGTGRSGWSDGTVVSRSDAGPSDAGFGAGRGVGARAASVLETTVDFERPTSAEDSGDAWAADDAG